LKQCWTTILLPIGRSDWIFDALKEDIAKDALSQKEIIDALSKQCIDIEINHIKEYVKRKKI